MTNDYFDALRAICQPMRATDFPRSLAPMRRLLTTLGNPQARFSSIVVTGSVGKGTISHQLSVSGFQFPASRPQSVSSPTGDWQLTSGNSVLSTQHSGLFTGPHLHSFRERLTIAGEPISQAEFIAGVNAVRKAINRTNDAFTTFEQVTAIAAWWFAERGVEKAVLEVGIGGRWDAVNAIPNALAVITPIEREHLAMLGGSLQTIAYHKAGIIQPNGHAISVQQSPVVADVLQHEADFKGADLRFMDWDQLVTQPINLLGRLEQITVNGHLILIDGGHTALSAARLRARIDALTGNESVRLVVGMLRDKAISAYLSQFDATRFQIILTQAPGHRALTPAELRDKAGLTQAHIELQPDLNAALKPDQNNGLLVVAGSLRMVAAAREAYGLLTPDELLEAQMTRTIFEGDDYLTLLNRQNFN